MFSVWVTLEVREGRVESFLEAISRNAARTAAEPGCVYFDVVELDAGARRYAFYEVYRDASAFLDEHRQAPHYATWRDSVERDVVPGSQIVVTGTRIIDER